MDYSKYVKYDSDVNCYFYTDEAFDLPMDDFLEVVKLHQDLNARLLRAAKMNVSTSDIVLAKNFNRKFDKSNVCLRVTDNLIEDYKKFAGSLDVPVQDFMTYVLEYGLTHYRCVKEI